MKIVAGLGNPGLEYDDTRHNVGWWMVDRLAHDWKLPPFAPGRRSLTTSGTVAGESVLLVKPTTYMNRSGEALAAFVESGSGVPERDLLVVVDDAALDVGRARLRPGGSAGGHNGLASVVGWLGTEEFSRLRIGVGRPPPGEVMVDWVLTPLPPEDEDVVLGLLPQLTGGVEVWLREGCSAAMNRINR